MSNTEDFYNAIVAANNLFVDTFNKGDAAGLAAQFTESCQFLHPNNDFVIGKEKIQAAYQGFFDMGIKSLKLETIEVDGHGDKIVEVGKYTLLDAENQTLDHGKYIVVWKNEGGQWKVHRDIINSSLP